VSSYPKHIDFWQIRRRRQGLPCGIMPFHREIADTLTKLTLGTLAKPNLMILMPPRCAKTDLGTQTFTAWAQSYFPDSEFILSSYAQDLAVENSVAIRSTLGSDWYRSMVGSDWGASVEMRGDNAGGRQDHFRTTAGGAIKAVGRGGGITGFGAGKLREEFGGAILVDDLLKANEAKSPAARKDAWNYLTGTLKSRRNRQETPITPMVLIMQRLHPEDPAGMLLREERDDWEVLQIEAHNSQNEVIWPGRLSMDILDKMRETDPDTYWAQYMQAPSQSARAIFKAEWWRKWQDRKKLESILTHKIITADTAFKPKDSADFSVFALWGFEGTKGAYLLDSVKGQWDFPELLKQAKAFLIKCQKDARTPVSEFLIEDKASGTSLVQTMRNSGLMAKEWLPPDKIAQDKVSRAKQCTIPLHDGRVFLPDSKLPGFKWVDNFTNEHTAFTDDDSHLYDDQVDTTTMALMRWQQLGGATGAIPQGV
jgi:predicted phage terminase large subunit-like protein